MMLVTARPSSLPLECIDFAPELRNEMRGVLLKLGTVVFIGSVIYFLYGIVRFPDGPIQICSESSVCEIIKEIENILIQDKRFHLPGKKTLTSSENSFEVVLVDVTETPVERPKKNNVTITQARKSDIHKKHK